MSKTAIGRLHVRDYLTSAFGFGLVLTTLVVLDPRVSIKFSRAFYPSPAEKLLSMGERVADFGRVVLMAAREQSVDHGPMLIMTVVGILLVAFMLRT